MLAPSALLDKKRIETGEPSLTTRLPREDKDTAMLTLAHCKSTLSFTLLHLAPLPESRKRPSSRRTGKAMQNEPSSAEIIGFG